MKLLDRIELYNSDSEASHGYVEIYDPYIPANDATVFNINTTLAKLASVCRGKTIADPDAFAKYLRTEHNGKAGVPFEFIPTVIKNKDGSVSTANLRATLEGKHRLLMPTELQRKRFLLFKIKFPYTIAAHVLHHRLFSHLFASERVRKLREYYLPKELQVVWSVNKKNYESWNDLCYNMSQCNWDEDQLAYKIRAELTNKGSHGLMFTEAYTAGWIETQNWGNFFKVRYENPAMPEIQVLSRAMLHIAVRNNFIEESDLLAWDCYYDKTPKMLERYQDIKAGNEMIEI